MSRGTTLYEGMTPTDDDCKRLLGQVFEVDDSLHNTGHRVGLVLLQNHAGSAYTVPGTGSVKGLKYQTTGFEDLGRKFNGAASTLGQEGVPLDDYYSSRLGTIADSDVCFGVAYGPVQMLKTSATSFSVGQALTVGADGKLTAALTTKTHTIWGVAATAYGKTATNCILLACPTPKAVF